MEPTDIPKEPTGLIPPPPDPQARGPYKDFLDTITSKLPPEGQSSPERSEDEVAARVRLFLDPSYGGPIFISKPIRKKVFIMRYPRFGEILEGMRIAGDAAKGTQSEAVQVALGMIGDIYGCLYGWLPEGDTGLLLIKEFPMDPSKWPTLRNVNWLASRDPYIFEKEIQPLWMQFQEWRREVTPTEEDLEKYGSLI